jgi:hypothetical protein
MGDLPGWQGEPNGTVADLFLYGDGGPQSRESGTQAANGKKLPQAYSSSPNGPVVNDDHVPPPHAEAVFEPGWSRSGDPWGAIIKLCKRSSAVIGNSRTAHAILRRKNLLVIDELHQIALLKATKHLDVADPSAVVWPAKMGTAIATERALGQYRRFGHGNGHQLHHWNSCFRWSIGGNSDRKGRSCLGRLF